MEDKARDAMNSIPTPDYDYQTLKAAILEVFQLTPENYRQKFRKMTTHDKESVKSYITKLGCTYDSCVKYSDIDPSDANFSPNNKRTSTRKSASRHMREHLLRKKILDTIELAPDFLLSVNLILRFGTKASH